MAGIGFEATGIPFFDTAKGNGNNFVNVVTYGDPVGEYGSDTEKNAPFVTSMPAGKHNTLDHYGKVAMIGDAYDSIHMQNKLNDWDSASLENVFDIVNVIPDFFKYHLPNTQAQDMGMSLSSLSLIYDAFYTQHGPIIPMGNDTIFQAMNYTPSVSKMV